MHSEAHRGQAGERRNRRRRNGTMWARRSVAPPLASASLAAGDDYRALLAAAHPLWLPQARRVGKP